MVDGMAGTGFDGVGVLTWGPDGRHLAHEARTDQAWRLVVDGVAGPEYGRIGHLPEHEWRQFSAGWRFDGPDRIWYVGRHGDSIVRWEVTVRPPEVLANRRLVSPYVETKYLCAQKSCPTKLRLWSNNVRAM